MNNIALISLALRMPAVTKCRIGFLAALVAVISVVGKEAIARLGLLNRNEAVVCIALGLVGFLSWMTGRLREGKRAQTSPSQAVPGDGATAEHPLAFFRSAKYWGIVLVLSSAILSLVAASHHAPVLTVRARPRPEVVATITNVVIVTNEAPKACFPRMALQGLVLNGAMSSALINGRVLCIGEGFSNVVLVAVDAEHATVEMEG